MAAPSKLYKFVLFLLIAGMSLYGVIYFELLRKVLFEKNGYQPARCDDDSILEDFQQIAEDAFVYSAYLDKRQEDPELKLIGMGPVNRIKTKFPNCFLVYKNWPNQSEWLATSPVKMQMRVLREHHNRNVTSVFFQCKLIGYFSNDVIPNKVIIKNVDGKGKHVSVRVKNIPPPTIKTQKRNFAVCVRPLFGPFVDTKKLAEFITFYVAMGADHFTFYNHHTGGPALGYLNGLKNLSNTTKVTVDVRPWSCPEKLAIWAMGQVAAVQECVYRHASDFKYLAIIDLDEYIVPRKSKNIVEMLNRLDSSKIGAFLFRQSFFCDENASKRSKVRNGTDMRILTALTREKYIWPPNGRSKVVIKPYAVTEGAIHFARNFTSKRYRQLVVGMNQAILHHLKFPACRAKKEHVTDKVILRFQKELKKAQQSSLYLLHSHSKTKKLISGS